MSTNVSFTVRRPSPVSRATSSGPDSDAGPQFKVPKLPPHLADQPSRLGSPLARGQSSRSSAPVHHEIDSNDEGSSNEDELVTGFDKFGVQRCVPFRPPALQLCQLTKVPFQLSLNGEKKVDKPLVIPALKNKDWRELARKRRGGSLYVPPSAAAETGKDGSVGGLGTKDTINSGPVLSGLQIKKKTSNIVNEEDMIETEEVKMDVVKEETEDERALRAILAESTGESQHEGPMIDIIPTPISETDALKQDVEELPNSATLEDYARVPVSQFGAALLRGMGWKEGTAATRKPGKGLVEPYLPAARPALLGIGAKEQEVYDDGSKKNGKSVKRPERRYVPVIKQERIGASSPTNDSRQRDRSRSPRRSGPPSRRPSPDRYNGRSEKDDTYSKRRYDDRRGKDRENERNDDRDRHRDQGRERERNDGQERDTSRRRDRERERPDDDRGSRRRSEHDRSERRREHSYDSNRRKRDY